MALSKIQKVGLALLLGSVATLPAAVAPVYAQEGSRRAESSVVAVQQLAENASRSVFAITLRPRATQFESISTDPGRPTLEIAQANRQADLPGRMEFRGLVRSIEFEPSNGKLALRFTPTAPSKIKAEASGADTILVTIEKLTGAEAIGARPVGARDEELQSSRQLPPAIQPYPGEDSYEMVFLRYADVSEIVGLLTDGVTVRPNNVFIRREPGFGSLGTGTQSSYQPPQPTVQEERPLGQAVDSSIAINRRLNAVWLRGSPEHIARLKDQIAMIDVPVDSVILETQFIELTEQGARAVGFDFTNANGQIAVGSVQYGQYVPFGLDPTQVQPSFNFQAALYAQIQNGEGRIVSRPRIAAQSGSTAKIITGDALPILTSITLSGVNGVSQQVQYVNVGVTLQIAPRVSPDGYVTSHIYGVVSSVTGYSQGYPTISQREAETSASVRDGETFVIGGLTQENSLSSRSRIPILGDIPLLGQLFRNSRSTRARTELYIVITPRIVRHRRFEDAQPEVSAQPPAVEEFEVPAENSW